MSVDFFKAYDRVHVEYLLKVMEKMNFQPTFITWIKILHTGAKTVFLLKNLTDPIEVNFSIRQGDSLAMILYIKYKEPLLLYLEKTLMGIRSISFTQFTLS